MQAAQSVTNAPRVTLQCVLADLAGQGDRWAQEELLRLYEPMIRSTSLKLVKGCVSQSFDDVKQLASMTALQLADTFRIGGGAVFTTYIFNFLGLKVRRSLDIEDPLVRIPVYLRGKDRKRLKETGASQFKLAQTTSINNATNEDGDEVHGADDLLALMSPASVIGDSAADSVDAQKAMQALQTLRPIERQVVMLRLADELSFDEIGEVVGISHQGAMAAYKRALKRLRDYLGAPQIENEKLGICAKKRGPRHKEATQ